MRGNGAVLPATGVKTRDAFIITTQTVLYIGERGGVRGGRGEREKKKRIRERKEKEKQRERKKRNRERCNYLFELL